MAERLESTFIYTKRKLNRRAFFKLTAGAVLLAEPAGQVRNFVEAKLQPDSFGFEVLKNETSPHTIIIAPGMQNDGHAMHNLLAPELSKLASVISIAYPTSDVELNMPLLFEGITAHMRKNNLRNPSFLGISLGGAINAELLPYFYASKDEFGMPQSFVCDSTPFNITHVREDQKFLAELGRHNRYSAILSMVKKAWASSVLPDPSSHQPGVRTDLVKVHLDAIADSSLWAVASQGDFLHQLHITPNSLEGMALRARYIITRNDPLVKCEEARADLQQIFGSTSFAEVIAPLRPIDRHACSSEFPAGTVALFAQDFELGI